MNTFLLLFRFKSKYGCAISSKITKLYFISNIIQLPRGYKIISNSVPLLNYPFNKKEVIDREIKFKDEIWQFKLMLIRDSTK